MPGPQKSKEPAGWQAAKRMKGQSGSKLFKRNLKGLAEYVSRRLSIERIDGAVHNI